MGTGIAGLQRSLAKAGGGREIRLGDIWRGVVDEAAQSEALRLTGGIEADIAGRQDRFIVGSDEAIPLCFRPAPLIDPPLAAASAPGALQDLHPRVEHFEHNGGAAGLPPRGFVPPSGL